jgi:hypothetical protein
MSVSVERVSTFGIAEVLYLLERGHTITDVAMAPSWPAGIDELLVTLAGEHIEADHQSYPPHSTPPALTRLQTAFDALSAAARRKAERGAL